MADHKMPASPFSLGETAMEQTEIYLSVGGVNIRVVSRLPLTVSDGMGHFLVPPSGDAVTITVQALEKDFDLTCAQTVGQDVHFTYYRDGGFYTLWRYPAWTVPSPRRSIRRIFLRQLYIST